MKFSGLKPVRLCGVGSSVLNWAYSTKKHKQDDGGSLALTFLRGQMSKVYRGALSHHHLISLSGTFNSTKRDCISNGERRVGENGGGRGIRRYDHTTNELLLQLQRKQSRVKRFWMHRHSMLCLGAQLVWTTSSSWTGSGRWTGGRRRRRTRRGRRNKEVKGVVSAGLLVRPFSFKLSD